MSGYRILPNAKPVLRSASTGSIEDYFVRRRARAVNALWLADNNRYRTKCVSNFELDIRSPLSRNKQRHFTAYVGASSPAHAMDGWSFLGRALGSAVKGDAYSACHFAYYAELRAVMSLMASQGIAVLSSRHAVVSQTGVALYPPDRRGRYPATHKLVWPLLKYWSTLERAERLFDQLIQPEQLALGRWVQGLMPGAPVRAIGQRWLSNWGLDLENVQEDHSIRNLASYRPCEFRYPARFGAVPLAQFICNLWSYFEPSPNRRFPGLERFLLKSAIQSRLGGAPNSGTLQLMGLTVAEANNWAAFLGSIDSCDLLTNAETSSAIETPTCHVRMISRASLLLFLASGAARRILAGAGYNQVNMAPWWHRIGIDRGLWSPGDIPNDPLDSWADVKAATDDLTTWCLQNPNASTKELQDDRPDSAMILTSLEHIGIWSLLP